MSDFRFYSCLEFSEPTAQYFGWVVQYMLKLSNMMTGGKVDLKIGSQVLKLQVNEEK